MFQQGEDDRQRISQLYARCFGRTATSLEQNRAVNFLADFRARTPSPGRDADSVDMDAWSALAHVLLASNEFIYVQ
jgi:hypothetical protein